ncbi:peptide deformylase [Rhodopseudomonas palustris]
MIRNILIHPDPRLKKVCEPVRDITPEVKALAADMLEPMYVAPGIGLAAPQVGAMIRLLVMDCIKDGPAEPMVLINPELVWASEDVSIFEEGCLSLPEQYAEVKRPSIVTVRWMDLDGAPQERTFDGLWATCVQHEMDHLDGKLFIDYLGPMKRQMVLRKLEKVKRERARMG